MGTPQTRWREMHQSGRVAIMLPHALFSPGRVPLHSFDGGQGFGPQVLTVHADEPLFGGSEDGGVVAAPAVGIAVVEAGLSGERAVILEKLDDERVGVPDGFAQQLFGKRAGDSFGLKETAGGIDGAVDGETVALADDEVLLTVAGGGVDCASSLLQGDVIAEEAEGVAVEKGVAEDGAIELGAGEAGDHGRVPAEGFGDLGQAGLRPRS